MIIFCQACNIKNYENNHLKDRTVGNYGYSKRNEKTKKITPESKINNRKRIVLTLTRTIEPFCLAHPFRVEHVLY